MSAEIDTKTLVERLRAYAKYRPLPTTQTSATLSQAADRLVALQNKLDSLPADWLEDSSLETWFPITAEQFISQQKRIAELERENTETQGALHAEMLDTSDLHSENLSLKNKVRELEDEITELAAGEDL